MHDSLFAMENEIVDESRLGIEHRYGGPFTIPEFEVASGRCTPLRKELPWGWLLEARAISAARAVAPIL